MWCGVEQSWRAVWAEEAVKLPPARRTSSDQTYLKAPPTRARARDSTCPTGLPTASRARGCVS